MKLKVKELPGFVRDSNNKAIVLEDTKQFEKYIIDRNYRVSLEQKQDILSKEVEQIKNDVSQIKDLLLKALEHKNNT